MGNCKWTVTAAVVASYAAILFFSFYSQLTVPAASGVPGSVDLADAWADLQQLTQDFHPFNSHANDNARDWLLAEIQAKLARAGVEYGLVQDVAVANSAPVTVYDDRVNNVTFGRSPASAAYFESTNVMVHIRGHGGLDAGAVLVNAHFDSVSTGYGATDDGVGIVSMIQLLRYFTAPENRPYRDIVLLFNNGEEDHLHGAFVFFGHPLSKLPSTFVNLEGAGSGGRAILFRSTDYEVTTAYASAPRPLGSVLTRDSFDLGLIRSQTDYFVFHEQHRLRGVDVAFFQPRSHYHTSLDSTRETSPDSVWNMLSAAIAATEALANDRDGNWEPEKGTPAVWADLFGCSFLLLRLNSVLSLSVLLALAAPVGAYFAIRKLKRDHRWFLFTDLARQPQVWLSDGTDSSPPAESEDSTTEPGPRDVQVDGTRGLWHFPLSLLSGFVLGLSTSAAIQAINPHLVYGYPLLTFGAISGAFMAGFWGAARSTHIIAPSAFARTYSVGWILLLSWIGVFVNGAVGLKGVGGGYPLVILFITSAIAAGVSLVEMTYLPTAGEYANILQNAEIEATATHGEQLWASALPKWPELVQMAVLLPNVIVSSQLALIIVTALHETAADGSSLSSVYQSMLVFGALFTIPAAPFLYRVSHHLPLALGILAVGTIVLSPLIHPFTSENPLVVRFHQKISADGSSRVTIRGLDGYVQDVVAAIVPGANCVNLEDEKVKTLLDCSWEEPVPPVLGLHGESGAIDVRDFISFSAHRLPSSDPDFMEAEVHIKGENSRGCRLHFDDPVSGVSVARWNRDKDGKDGDGEDGEEGDDDDDDTGLGYAPVGLPDDVDPTKFKELRLWTRDWASGWAVKVRWPRRSLADPAVSDALAGWAECFWSDQNDPRTIPALTKVRKRMPAWSAVTKLEDGLVNAERPFIL